MVKKALALTAVLMLLAPLAVASGPQGLRLPVGQERRAAGLRPNFAKAQAEGVFKQEGTKPADLLALAESDPAALKEKMLARHDAMVKQAEELIANKAGLPEKIAADLLAAQARAQALATERAKEAKNPALAEKRLANLSERQAKMSGQVEEHAEQIAERMIARANQVLANAAAIRERIEKGEGLAVLEELREKRQEQRAPRRGKRPSKVTPGQ